MPAIIGLKKDLTVTNAGEPVRPTSAFDKVDLIDFFGPSLRRHSADGGSGGGADTSPAVPKEVARYIEQLRDTDSDVRMRAASMLAFIGAPAVEPLKEMLTVDDPRVAGAATWVLGKIIDPRAVPGLIGVLNDHKNPGARTAAAQALGVIKAPNAVPALIEALSNKDRGLQVAAARALGEIGNKRAVTPLKRQLKLKPDVYVRACLNEAIKKLEAD